MRRLLTLMLLGLTLSGCGFKLKGSYQLPEQLHHLVLTSPDEYGQLTQLLKSRLKRYQVEIASPGNTKLPVLSLGKDKLERGTLSLFSTGQVAEYELIYSVNYQLGQPGDEPQSFKVEIRRDYLDDPQTAQAKSREMALLLKEMRIQAADQIVRQLSRQTF